MGVISTLVVRVTGDTKQFTQAIEGLSAPVSKMAGTVQTAVGAIGATFYLIPELSLDDGVRAAAAINLFIGLVSLAFARNDRAPVSRKSASRRYSPVLPSCPAR